MGEPKHSMAAVVDLVRVRLHLKVFRIFIERADSAHYRNYVLEMFDDFRDEIDSVITEAEAARTSR